MQSMSRPRGALRSPPSRPRAAIAALVLAVFAAWALPVGVGAEEVRSAPGVEVPKTAMPALPVKETVSNEDLAKDTQNPVADLISVPFQNNFNFGVGPENRMVWNTNFQPVIPVHLSENWNLISRTILHIDHVPPLRSGAESVTGIGDLNPTLFFSPAKAKHFVWGVGPTMTLPTASDRLLGSGKWSAGPAFVGLFMEGSWVVGALANHQWSFAGWGDRPVNQLLIQPFVNYNFPSGWYLTSAPIITGNFSRSSGDHWVLPIGGGGGRVLRVGKLPLNLSLVPYWNVVTPDGGADWQLRFTFSMLFPE